MDLETEFQKLVDEMYQRIQTKQAAGELTSDQAQVLREMVQDRLKDDFPVFDPSEYSYDDSQDAWSASQVCW